MELRLLFLGWYEAIHLLLASLTDGLVDALGALPAHSELRLPGLRPAADRHPPG